MARAADATKPAPEGQRAIPAPALGVSPHFFTFIGFRGYAVVVWVGLDGVGGRGACGEGREGLDGRALLKPRDRRAGEELPVWGLAGGRIEP